MSRTLVLGDVHGAARALEQVLDRAGFDPAADRVVSLGDICDRGIEVDRCFDLLLGVRHLTLVLGNHDEWALEWMADGRASDFWVQVGGAGTIASYAHRFDADPGDRAAVEALAGRVPEAHVRVLRDAVDYHIEPGDHGGRLFTHAGWNPGKPAEDQSPHALRMGRELWAHARVAAARDPGDDARLTPFAEVFLGQTPTEWLEPRPVLEIWNLDQGAGWDGVLTLMDADTKEYWQSDPVTELYPG